jgi:excisionase family DNA binding protein
MGMDKEQQLTPREAAKRLGVRLDYVYALIWVGKLQASRKDGRWLVSATSVRRRLQDRRKHHEKSRD